MIDRALMYTDARHIHLVVPDPDVVASYACERVTIHADMDVCPFDRDRFLWRSNWVYQQFIKLFQQVTSTDWYLCFCSDLVLNKNYPVFLRDTPLMVLGRDRFNRMDQYNLFNEKMIRLKETAPYNFISDGPLYNREIINDMLESNGYTSAVVLARAAVRKAKGGS